MPAMNWASPPNMAANGASASGDFGSPHQPARFEATMKVAPANPASPRIDGAAIGCRNTRVPNPFADSLTPAEAVALRSSSVLILASFTTDYDLSIGWFPPQACQNAIFFLGLLTQAR